MRRTFDSTYFNIIANTPEVRKWLGFAFDGEVDLSSLVNDFNNVCFLTENNDGGYILINNGSGQYVAHTMSLPSARGKPMYKLMQDGFRHLFLNTDCIEISTFVPDGADNALAWTKLARFRPTFRREKFIPLEGELVGGQFFTMTYGDWVQFAPKLKEAGQEFHDFIENAIGHENHEHDPVHDRWAGATYLGCKEGNVAKVIHLYNQWGKLAGYYPAEILNNSPPVINIGNVILEMFNGSMSVLKILEGQ